MNNSLKTFLAKLSAGQVNWANKNNLERLLAKEWDSFSSSDNGGMQSYKIINRTESLFWKPPILTFTIERHGSTVNGSTRGELQEWEIDISAWAASIISTRRRQVRPAAKRVNVKEFIPGIVNAILNGLEHSSLKWYPDRKVKVLISTIIPDDGYKQTASSRRKKFREALETELSRHDWLPSGQVGSNTYERR